MKHIKLFENYDRYEFGTYRDQGVISDIWKRYVETVDEHVLFSEDEYTEVHNLIKTVKNQRVYDNRGHIYLAFDSIGKEESVVSIVIVAMGDYCFGLFVEHEIPNTSFQWDCCYIVDGIEDLCKILTDEIAKYNHINESFDRYEFGEFNDPTYVSELAIAIESERDTSFADDEMDIIENVLSDNLIDWECSEERYDIITCRQDYELEMIYIYPLGDYCYAVVHLTLDLGLYVDGDVDGENEFEEYHKVWIVDQLEELVNLLNKIL
jgi:hypothetical protein